MAAPEQRRMSVLVGRPARPADQALRYALVGACGYVLAMALYAAQIELGLSPYAAVPLTFVANGLFNFAVNRRWSFHASGRPVISDLRRFSLVAVVSLLVNYGSLYVLYDLIGIPAVPAQAIAILIAVPVGFLGNQRWAFRAS